MDNVLFSITFNVALVLFDPAVILTLQGYSFVWIKAMVTTVVRVGQLDL
jgi:hypothetical protein